MRLTEALCLLLSVWDTYLALRVLCGGEARALEVGLDPSKSSRVQACLAWRPEGQGDVQQGWMRALLKRLATRGFAAIPTDGEGQGDVQQGRMRDVLKRLATHGFAPIPTRGDELAEVRLVVLAIRVRWLGRDPA
jgi:hypothetical protein